MWARNLRPLPVRWIGAIAGMHGVLSSRQFIACDSAPDKKEENEMLNIYLKKDSKKLLEKYLTTRGYASHKVDYVCLHSNADSSTSYVFQPIFGQRTAFRIKGIVSLPDGNAVAIGKLSNMVGEVKDDHFEVSMPIVKKDATDSVDQQLLADIPTRLRRIFDPIDKQQWKGRIPAGKVGIRNYDAIQASYVSIPLMKQLVVDGSLCSSKFVDEEGKCHYEEPPSTDSVSDKEDDRLSDIISHEVEEKHLQSSSAKVEDMEKEIKPPAEEKNKAECPVCRYMKGGPCKDEFIVWDNCLSQLKEGQELTECAKETGHMMKCMQQYEYYDIMTAGTDYGRVESILLEPPSENASSTTTPPK